MADLPKVRQGSKGTQTGMTPSDAPPDPENRGAEFGTSERATRGTNRDADRSGKSENQGHGHPREDRSDES